MLLDDAVRSGGLRASGMSDAASDDECNAVAYCKYLQVKLVGVAPPCMKQGLEPWEVCFKRVLFAMLKCLRHIFTRSSSQY